ncbi:hypothetical protein BGX26_011031 [Mortierella sp. AD094]|nr:hypothetical protein BGX26_011031 [Mortierella sp. AD094]
MLLKQLTLILVTVAYVYGGQSFVRFYQDGYSQKVGWQASIDKYYQCYNAAYFAYEQISNVMFYNAEWLKWHFTLTVYSNVNCSGDYKQWQLNVGTYNSWVAGFVGETMNDRINSWKILDRKLGDDEGHIDVGESTNEWFKQHFTLTVYSNVDCSGDYRQWQLDVGTYKSWVAGFVGGTMKGRINSWKISDQKLGDAEGHIGEGDLMVDFVPWFHLK